MKKIYLFLTILVASCSSTRPPAQGETSALINSGEFQFIAQTMSPSSITPANISGSGYGLKLMDDSLSVILPFFGRAFGAGNNRNGGPIQLNTKAFTSSNRINNGRWEFNFEPADQSQVRQLILSVSENGYASLQVLNTNRESVSFNGVVETIKEK